MYIRYKPTDIPPYQLRICDCGKDELHDYSLRKNKNCAQLVYDVVKLLAGIYQPDRATLLLHDLAFRILSDLKNELDPTMFNYMLDNIAAIESRWSTISDDRVPNARLINKCTQKIIGKQAVRFYLSAFKEDANAHISGKAQIRKHS